MLNIGYTNDIGLLNGKIGIAIYFYYLSRKTESDILDEYASELIDQATDSLNNQMSLDFETGISGIGWAIEHLIQSGFIAASADDILEEFDSKFQIQLIYETNDIENVISMIYYHVSRLRYRLEGDVNPTALRLKYNLISLVNEAEINNSKIRVS